MKKKILITIGIIIIVAGLIMGGIGLKRYLAERNAGKVYENLKVEVELDTSLPGLDDGPVEVPIDFDSITEEYPDVYAWIRIPGTQIDYPIVQREGDNDYYLNHTVDGRQRIEGAIFTEDYNGKDFSDPNTLIYGHNMKNGSMFKGLHKYKDKKFLKENSTVYVYQKDRILEYRIFAAYVYDSRHLMMSFDFEDENIFRSYLNNVLTKTEMGANIDTSVEVSPEDRIITMSTCNNNDNQRYLVQAVLISIRE